MVPSINVHGMTVEQAISHIKENLLSFKNRGFDIVYIIHGKGTGKLRAAIRNYLIKIPYVDSIRNGTLDEGSTGVTIVKFRAKPF